MLCARLGFHGHIQGHNKWSKVNLSGFRVHLLHAVTFLVSFLRFLPSHSIITAGNNRNANSLSYSKPSHVNVFA